MEVGRAGLLTDRIPDLTKGRAHCVSRGQSEYDTADIGYVLTTLHIAMRAFSGNMNFEESLVWVVNEGGDADTNGAVAGALLGASDGIGAIPER